MKFTKIYDHIENNVITIVKYQEYRLLDNKFYNLNNYLALTFPPGISLKGRKLSKEAKLLKLWLQMKFARPIIIDGNSEDYE